MGKVLIFTRHTKKEFGEERMKLLKKIHGKRTEVVFDSLRFLEATQEANAEKCIEYFTEKINEGFYCYVVLPGYLREALLAQGISFGTLPRPRQVNHGYRICVEHYSPEVVKQVTEKIVSKITDARFRESRDYVNKKHVKKK